MSWSCALTPASDVVCFDISDDEADDDYDVLERIDDAESDNDMDGHDTPVPSVVKQELGERECVQRPGLRDIGGDPFEKPIANLPVDINDVGALRSQMRFAF